MIIKLLITIFFSSVIYLITNYFITYFYNKTFFLVISFIIFSLKWKFIKKDTTKNIFLKNFTLLVPAKNEEKRIEDSMKFLLNLDYPKEKFNVIIINDNSTDNTLLILEKMNLPENFKIYNRNRNEGFVAGVLNDGLKIISDDTEIVGIIDSDCLISNQLLNKVSEYFQNNFKEAVQISEWHYNCNDNLLTMSQHLLCIYENYCIQSEPEFKVGHFYHKDLIKSFKEYNEKSIIEDFELSYDLIKKNFKIKTISDILIFRKFPKSLKKIYSQQYRYALGKQMISFRDNIIQYEIILPIILVLILVDKNLKMFFLIFIYLVVILLNSWYLYYDISHESALKYCPWDIYNKILLQGNKHCFKINNIFGSFFVGIFIILLRILPFLKISINLEEIKWNRF